MHKLLSQLSRRVSHTFPKILLNLILHHSIRLKFLVLTCQCQGEVVKLKKLTQSHHRQHKEDFNSCFFNQYTVFSQEK